MSDFSGVVDELVAELLRPDMRVTIVESLNHTIRELHTSREGRALLFPDNLVEAEITADAEEGFTWAIPRPQRFQLMESVYYASVGLYSRLKYPSSAYAAVEEINGLVYHYRTGNFFAFSGYGGLDAAIKLAYYEYPRRLTYYAVADRPAKWSAVDESWSYHADYDLTAELRAQAQDLSTNWMLIRYTELLKEGVRAKIYKRLKDSERARMSFSAYESMKAMLFSAETQEHSPTIAQ